MFCTILLFCTVVKVMCESQWRRLTHCPLQLLPWWSWFGGGWRCSSVPALSAGQVCGNPPWRQNVKFLSTRKKVDQLRTVCWVLCVLNVCVWESEGCQRAAPVCVCVSDGGREKERENRREVGFIIWGVQTHRCTRTHTHTHTRTHTHTHRHTHRGGGEEEEPSDVSWVLLLKSNSSHFIGYCITGMVEVCHRYKCALESVCACVCVCVCVCVSVRRGWMIRGRRGDIVSISPWFTLAFLSKQILQSLMVDCSLLFTHTRKGPALIAKINLWKGPNLFLLEM